MPQLLLFVTTVGRLVYLAWWLQGPRVSLLLLLTCAASAAAAADAVGCRCWCLAGAERLLCDCRRTAPRNRAPSRQRQDPNLNPALDCGSAASPGVLPLCTPRVEPSRGLQPSASLQGWGSLFESYNAVCRVVRSSSGACLLPLSSDRSLRGSPLCADSSAVRQSPPTRGHPALQPHP
eukprot:191443-Chlamydomonas_euryale.AAC.12